MERTIDKERYIIIERLKKRKYTYTIRNDITFSVGDNKIRIIMVECLSKQRPYEYFPFINGKYRHVYVDALRMIKELDIAREFIPVYESPKCDIEELF